MLKISIVEVMKFFKFNEILHQQSFKFHSGVTYVEEANTPAFYEFKPYANLRNPFRIIFPERLRNFALIATIRITHKPEGYLFSIGKQAITEILIKI